MHMQLIFFTIKMIYFQQSTSVAVEPVGLLASAFTPVLLSVKLPHLSLAIEPVRVAVMT